MPLREVATNVHVHERSQSFYGIEVGTRMTILALQDGLLLHSPTDLDPGELDVLGRPRWILAPNKLHHLYAGPWMARGLEGWCAQGLEEKRKDLDFAGVVSEEMEPFGDEVLLVPLTSFSFTNEVLLLHRASRTLVATDLVFNFAPSVPLKTRILMRCCGGYPGCRTTILERFAMNRPAARSDLARLLELDFDRLIPSHGEIVETGGKQALRSAFAWLGV